MLGSKSYVHVPQTGDLEEQRFLNCRKQIYRGLSLSV